MGKKKKEHVSFGNKALNKNGIPFGKVNGAAAQNGSKIKF